MMEFRRRRRSLGSRLYTVAVWAGLILFLALVAGGIGAAITAIAP